MKKIFAVSATALTGAFLFIGTGFMENTVEKNDEPFVCDSEIDIDLLKIRMETTEDDALILKRGCSGRIGRVEIDTWQVDGIKVRNQGTGAPASLTIEGGYVRCHAHREDAHQDGFQGMTGQNILLQNLSIRCGLSNSQFFVSSTSAQNVICDNCNLGAGASHTANVWGSSNGVRNSVLCKPQTSRYFTKHGSVIDENNERALAGDLRCE